MVLATVTPPVPIDTNSSAIEGAAATAIAAASAKLVIFIDVSLSSGLPVMSSPQSIGCILFKKK